MPKTNDGWMTNVKKSGVRERVTKTYSQKDMATQKSMHVPKEYWVAVIDMHYCGVGPCGAHVRTEVPHCLQEGVSSCPETA